MQRYLVKIDRIAAWVLLCGMLLYFITGYGMTKGIIDPALATKLHLNFLTYIVAIAFIIHTSYAIHLAFKRWRIWNGFSATILFLVYLSLIFGLIYVDKYYGKTDDEESVTQNVESTKKTASSTSNNVTTQSESTSQTTTSSVVKTFTLSELAKYNGQNGNPAYVAVDGQVYDLTSVFENGKHFSHYAGKELTNAFYSYHAKIVLAKYPIVGTLAK
jgi:predicted heme/steroid binding protein